VTAAGGVLAGWERDTFSAGGITHDTFRRGSGPGVVVLHEIPGITPLVARFANDVVDAGFTVVMPSLIGTPGKPASVVYGTTSMLRLCISREFTHWALNRTSPVVAWLRAVARALHNDTGGPGVGAVGMCFSGGFALGMMVDDVTVAPVLSQPSLPLALGRAERKADVGLAPDDLAAVVQRARAGCDVLGLRFVHDSLVGTRFDTLRQLLGDAFIAVELPSPTKRAHSVLTEERDEAAVARVVEFLRGKLLT
jgi:dienelactone hydrolase